MRFAIVGCALGLAACGGSAVPTRFVESSPRDVPKGEAYRWTFDDPAGTPGTGARSYRPERVFESVLGRWGVESDAGAASGSRVYRQSGRFLRGEAARVIVADLGFGDQTVRVKCRPETGENVCGLMFHVRSQANYLLARADGEESTIRLSHVRNGVEYEIARVSAEITPWVWHALAVRTRGDEVRVDWDGARVLETTHEGASHEGRIGLWTRGDSVTSFDDLEVSSD